MRGRLRGRPAGGTVKDTLRSAYAVNTKAGIHLRASRQEGWVAPISMCRDLDFASGLLDITCLGIYFGENRYGARSLTEHEKKSICEKCIVAFVRERLTGV
jgi:hypothetical protein